MSPTPLLLIIALVAVAVIAAGIATVGFLPTLTVCAIASTVGIFFMLVGISRV